MCIRDRARAVAFVRRVQQVMRLRVERADLRCCRADVDPDVDGGYVSHRCSSDSAGWREERVANACRSVFMVVYPTRCWKKATKYRLCHDFRVCSRASSLLDVAVSPGLPAFAVCNTSVSYTHLDVYKRQRSSWTCIIWCGFSRCAACWG